jgi:hypothetical protein
MAARAAAIKAARRASQEESEEPKPQKIDLHDAGAVKHRLDSAAAEVILNTGM